VGLGGTWCESLTDLKGWGGSLLGFGWSKMWFGQSDQGFRVKPFMLCRAQKMGVNGRSGLTKSVPHIFWHSMVDYSELVVLLLSTA
jgi:hypothetical protein